MVAPAGLVLVLALSAADPGLPYAPLPTTAELSGLTERLVHDLRADGIRVEIDAASCDDETCARRLGKARGAEAVIFGRTIRAMAMIWSTSATVTGTSTGYAKTFDAGYKGDYTTMCVGMDDLAAALRTSLPLVSSR